MRPRGIALGFAVAALLGLTLNAQPARDELAIRDVSVVDAGRLVPNRTILVRGGRIVSIADAAEAISADVTIDGTGLFAIPGLIDAHVHLSGAPREQATATLKRALAGGITSVFDLAGDDRETGDLARASLAHEIEAPTIRYVGLLAGPAFFKDPRVLAASLGFDPGLAPWAQAVTADSDPVRTIAAARGTGASAIKLYAAIDAVTAKAMTAEAHRAHLRVFAHATTFPARPSELIEAGVDMLAHAAYLVWEGSAPSDDFKSRANGDFAHVPFDGPVMDHVLDLMVSHNTALNPTLWIFAEGTPKDALSAQRIAWMDGITGRAARRGVPIVAGTDDLLSPRDPLPTLHRELELLVSSAGLTPAQALESATRTAARVMGMDKERGRLEPGFAADIDVLSANPLDAIGNTRKLAYVIKDGRIVLR